MECPYCKAENRDGVRYCGTCGNLMNPGPVPTTQPSHSGSRSLAPGSRLQGGRYVVKRMLGEGGMGTALLATDIRLDSKSVVIKELISDNVDPAKLQEDVRNFKREVSTLAHIDHPLVPNVTDHFQEGSHYFMVQEYVEGENLEERLDRTNQPMKEREALICASEILDVLEYLAEQTPPVVHRDIKPANIIIGAKDKRAHLVDFGIARAEVARNAQRKQTSALGTPGYAPPEQYQGNADPRSDLYALAATLHHILTNRDPRNHPPFSYPPVRALNPQLSPEIERVLARTLNNDINQRYQSASAMKQDIDAILRQRFGISGNIDTYTLGNSGAMSPVNVSSTAQTVSQAQTVQQPSLHGIPPTTPVSMPPIQPLATTAATAPAYPYQQQFSSQPPVSQPRRRFPRFALILIIVMLIVLAGSGIFFFVHQEASATASGIGATQMSNNEYIGISDGTFAFDTTLDSGSLKTQAAQLLKQGSKNTNQVISLLNQAVEKSPNDAEALIYKEDLTVLSSGRPYVDVVVATMLTGGSSLAGLGRDDLQGAYVAQQEYNTGYKLNGGVQVRLLIANSGSQATYATTIAQQIVRLAQHDTHFVGVMGWPYSDRTLAAIQVLNNAHIPLISQTASSDALTGISHYFFRIAPSNHIQGVNGAKYAEQVLKAKRVALFYDPTNSYTQSLAQDFAQQFRSDGNQVVVTEKYTVGNPATLPPALQDALSHKPDLIYFSGYASDLSPLLVDLPTNSTIPILGGDALYELDGYSSSASAGFTHVHFTAFAYPDEWSILKPGTSKPAFFADYTLDFNSNGQHATGAYGFTRADSDAMLSYDATIAIFQGCNIALKSGQQTITPQDLQQALLKVNGANAIQGVSGQISFGQNGDPVNKVIVVLDVDSHGRIHMESVSLGQFLV